MHFVSLIDISLSLSIIFFVIIFLFLTLIISCSIYLSYLKKKRRKMILISTMASDKIYYTYNLQTDLITYFHRLNSGHERCLTVDEFLSEYIAEDKLRVKKWLKDAIDNKDVYQFLQVRRYFPIVPEEHFVCILLLTKVSNEEKMIHFELHFLPSVNTFYPNKVKHRLFLSNEKTIEDINSRFNDKEQGAIYYLSLFKISDSKNATHSKQKNIKNKIINDAIIPYLSPLRNAYSLDDNTFIIVDSESFSEVLALTYATAIQNIGKQIIKANQGENLFDFIIGISMHDQYSPTFSQCKNQAKMMIDLIRSRKSFDKVLMYTNDLSKNIYTEEKNRNEALLFIKNSTFKIMFLSSIDLETLQRGPTFLRLDTYGVSFKKFKDLLSLSTQFSYDKKETINLLRTLDMRLKERLYREIDDPEIVLELPYDCLDLFMEAISYDNKRNFKYVLSIDENELSANISNQKEILAKIKAAKERELLLALSIKTSSPIIERAIFSEMKYFIFNDLPTLTKNIQRATTQADLESISSFYSTFPQKLCYINLSDKMDVDIALHYSGKIIQSSYFSKPSSRREPIEEEVIQLFIEDKDQLFDEDIE